MSPVLVDTDVFSRLFVRRSGPRAESGAVEAWRQVLRGRQVVIAFQTRAEVLQGALAAEWGSTRMGRLRAVLDARPTVGVDHDVIDAHAVLFAACRRSGHALHDKGHTGDRWVASCAIAKNLPILAGDRIYRDAPALRVVSTP